MAILNISLWKANGFAGDIGLGNVEDYGFEEFDWHIGAATMADALKVYDQAENESKCGRLEYVAPLVVYQGEFYDDEAALWLVKGIDDDGKMVDDTEATIKDYVVAPTIIKAIEAFKEQFTNPELVEITSVTFVGYTLI